MSAGFPSNELVDAKTGTPQRAWQWLRHSVCDQTLPTAVVASILLRSGVPTNDYTDTSGALVGWALSPHDYARLRFIGSHATSCASLQGTARFWLASESTYEGDTGFGRTQPPLVVTPAFDLTLDTSASPPAVTATGHAASSGVSAWIDALAGASITANYLPVAPAVVGNGLELYFDTHGAKYLIGALKRGTFASVLAGLRQV